MGKRGPKPQSPYDGARKVISTKVTSTLRGDLEKSAKDNGRTLSAEIEHRLRRSFDEDQGLIERLGGRQLYAILRLISATMNAAGRQSMYFKYCGPSKEDQWLNDPYAYDRATKATNVVLEALRPPGESKPPQRISKNLERAVDTISTRLLFAVEEAEPGLPIPSDPDDEDSKLARRIAMDLEEVTERLKARRKLKYQQAAAELSKLAQRLKQDSDQ